MLARKLEHEDVAVQNLKSNVLLHWLWTPTI